MIRIAAVMIVALVALPGTARANDGPLAVGFSAEESSQGDSTPDLWIGAHVDRVMVAAYGGFHHGPHVMRDGEDVRSDALDFGLLAGGWFESGRWNLLATVGAGATDRWTNRPILITEHLRWTAGGGPRVMLAWRFGQTSWQQPAHLAVDFALAVEARGYATIDGEAIGFAGLSFVMWRAPV